MKSRQVLVSALLAASLGVFTAPALVAATVSTTGASATRNSNTVSITDTGSDSHAVYALVNNSSNRLNNINGYNATVSRTYAFTVTAVQACVNVQLGKDRCSNWG